jgi:hypothetical protein
VARQEICHPLQRIASHPRFLFTSEAVVVFRPAGLVAVPVFFGASNLARLACSTDRMSAPMSPFGFAAGAASGC